MSIVDGSKAAGFDAFCPLTTSSETATALDADGAYRADVLRTVRGTRSAEESAALVAALLLSRHVRTLTAGPDETGGADEGDGACRTGMAAPEQHHRPSGPRERYAVPAPRTARP